MPEKKLNKAQKEAISYTDGPLLIIAGAGTGKTTVITQKIAHLIQSGLAKPQEILALTFTDKAAEEMQNRVDELVNIGYTELQISTFHSFCQRLLQDYGLDIGIPNQFRLLTETDAWLLVREHLYDFDLNYYRPLGNPTSHIHELLSHFSKCKDELISAEAYLQYAEELELGSDEVHLEQKNKITEVANAYHKYNQLLLDNQALDFGDLLFYNVKLLEERKSILDRLQNKYKYILVDEFQDVNWAQYQFVKLLAEKSQFTVVGDDDQSIYAFRGASVSNILRFDEDYPKAKKIVLTENYRSKQEILNAAYKSIQHNNPDRLETKLHINKKLLSSIQGDSSAALHIHRATLQEEVHAVIEEIFELKEQYTDATWDDFAILVRANNHAEPFFHALEIAGIPYEFLAAAGLHRQKIVMDAVNMLRAVHDVRDSRALFQWLHLPVLQLTENDRQKLLYQAKKKSASYYEALKRVAEFQLSEEGIRICEKILQLIHEGARLARHEKPTKVLYALLEESGYLAYLTHEEQQGNRAVIRSIYHLRQLFDLIEAYEQTTPEASVHLFIQYYNHLIEAGDAGKLYQPEDTPDSVNVLTVHSAKGLEFRFVFIVNLVQDRFPSRKRGEGIEVPEALIHEILPEGDYHEEEERRLFYVAVTRAKERVYFFSSEEYGGTRAKKISKFLAELGYEGNKAIKQENKKTKITNHNVQACLVGRQVPKKEEDIHYILPKKFSYSQIKSYEACPYQYKLAHLLKIPVEGKGSFSFGQTMHLTLQRFYEMIVERNSAVQSNLFDAAPQKEKSSDKIHVPTLEELLAVYEQSFIPDWYASEKQRKAYFQKGKDILKLLYTSEEAEHSWRIPVALESWFQVRVGPYAIHGRIDRIDQLEDGTLEIIDYKTGKSKETLTSEDKEQLLIYQIAAESLPEYRNIGKTKKLTFYYLNDQIKTSFAPKDTEIEKLKNTLIKTIEGIRAQNFTATPGTHVCASCDFRSICEFRAI